MTRNELGNPEASGVPDGSGSGSRGAPETSRASDDSPARAEQASRPDARRARQGADRVPAETLTREEYGDSIRDEGAPIRTTDAFRHESSGAVEGDSSAGNRDDAGTAEDRAEPRGPETYADHIRAGQHDPIPERPVTGLEQGPEPSSAAIAADAGEPGMGLGEPRSRDEYADTAARAAAFDEQIEAVATADHDAPGARQYGTAADNAEREMSLAGPLLGSEGDARAPGDPAADPGAASGQASRALDSDTAAASAPAELPAAAAAGSEQPENPGDPTDPGEQGHGVVGPGQITHYYSEFKGRPVDLYTDGSRWAPGDRAHGQDVSHEPRRTHGSMGDLPHTAERVPGADRGTASEHAETSPGTVYVQGKEVEVSGIAADGIWVGGLPGEMPGTPYGDPYGAAKVGDILASTDTEKSVAEGLRDVFTERAEDIVDATEKDLNEAQQLFRPGPTHSETAVPAAHARADTPYHEIGAGNAATAVLAVGFAAWAIHHAWRQWNDQRRDREAHLHGGD